MSEAIALKKYVLSDAIKSTAAIYVKTSENVTDGIRLTTPKRVTLHLAHVFTDKAGKQKKTRYKQGASSGIWQDKQIKDDNIPANDKFSDDERRDLQFVNGLLIAEESDELKVSFLDKDNNPQHEEFTGRNRNGITPVYRELDENALIDSENDFLLMTSQALTKIMAMERPEVAALLAMFYGSSFPIPEKVKECRNIACKALESNEQRLKMVINGEWGIDGKITILLSKALNKNVLSFETKPDYVQVKKNGEWIDVKMIVADTFEQREILFRQYLATEAGELLRNDLEAMVDDSKEKKQKPK